MKPMPGVATALAHFLGLVAHHHENALRRSQLERGFHHVLHQRLAAGAVQHFGLARFHAGAQTRGQNHDGNGRSIRWHHVSSVLAAPALLRQLHHHGGGGFGIVPDFLLMLSQVAGHHLEAHLEDGLDIVFHGLGLLPGVALLHGRRNGPDVHHGVLQKLAARVLMDGPHVVGGAEAGGLAGLPHQVHEIGLHGRRTGDGRWNALHQHVRDHAGEQRSRPQCDDVGLGDGAQCGGQRPDRARNQVNAANPCRLRLMRVSPDHARAIGQDGLQRNIGGGGGIDAAARS